MTPAEAGRLLTRGDGLNPPSPPRRSSPPTSRRRRPPLPRGAPRGAPIASPPAESRLELELAVKFRPAAARRPADSLNPTGGRLGLRFDSDGLGGLFIGAVFYAMVLSVIEYGPEGPLLWLKAEIPQ